MRSSIAPGSALLLALALVQRELAAADSLFQSYCSSENTGSDGDAKYWTWQSNGWCHDQCVDSYAFAVVQGNNCWCSNYVPADQQSVGKCNEDCPGFPSEQCGDEDASLFGYIALDIKPSGTKGAVSTTSSAQVSTPSSIISSETISSQSPETSVRAPSHPSLSSPIPSYPFVTRASRASPLHFESSKYTSQVQSPSTFLIIRSTSLVIVSSFVVLSTYITIPFSSSSAPPSSSFVQSDDEPETVFRTVTETPSQIPSSAILTSASAKKTSVAPVSTTTSQAPSTTASSTTSWTPTPVTSVQVITVSGSVVTKTVTGMSTPPAQMTEKKSSTSGGAIAGIVIGSLVGAVLIAAALFWFFFYRKRRVDKTNDSEAAANPPQRNTSTMSKTGLLKTEKPAYPPVITNIRRSSTHALDQTDSISSPSSDRRNSRPLFYDQRLNPSALMDLDNGSHASIITIEDNRDYTRTLNIRNPDSASVRS